MQPDPMPWEEDGYQIDQRRVGDDGVGSVDDKFSRRWENSKVSGIDGDPYPQSEAGDAEFFERTVGGRALYDHSQRRWFLFDGHHWRLDATGRIVQMAIETMRQRQALALRVTDTTEKTKRVRRALAGRPRLGSDTCSISRQPIPG